MTTDYLVIVIDKDIFFCKKNTIKQLNVDAENRFRKKYRQD